MDMGRAAPVGVMSIYFCQYNVRKETEQASRTIENQLSYVLNRYKLDCVL